VQVIVSPSEEKERKIELLKKIIEDQSILINKLQGYLNDTIEIPKKIVRPNNKITIEEATENIKRFLKIKD
tara:strand:- start:342 stop:554 length:213 start_codon:yes stop_codon:yes gene_type:complete